MSTQQVDQEEVLATSTQAALESMTPVEFAPLIILGKHHNEFSVFHESYVRHYIQFADTKAGVCFTVISTVIGYLISRDEVQGLIIKPAWSGTFIVTAATLIVLFTSAAFAFAVIAPRLGSVIGEDIVFFGAVAKRKTGEAYVKDVATLSDMELTSVRLMHSFVISKICTLKYRWLRWAIWLALPGLVLALFTLILA